MRLPDFEAASRLFRSHRWDAHCYAEGIWRFRSTDNTPALRLVVTAGVHGDETAPIEMLARRLPQWAADAPTLNIDLFVALGNLDAIAAGRRYLVHDMNRMFGEGGAETAWEAEGRRAQLLMNSIACALDAPGPPAVHLDLHTTIRPSLLPTFAIVPEQADHGPLLRWLDSAGLHAAVLSPGRHTTLSWRTSRMGAASCTVELGRVGQFGSNNHDTLAVFDASLDRLVREAALVRDEQAGLDPAIPVFRVTRELIRSSERFVLLVPASAPNFTRLSPGQAVARDQGEIVRASDAGEYVLFPNPTVAVGQRAGLLVAPVGEPAA